MQMARKMALLLGSPRHGGNSEVLAEAFLKGAKGFDVTTVRLNDLTLRGCTDCRKCWSTGEHCVLNDDMHKVYAALDDAEVIAFATPLYFYTWPAQVKPVWDRLLPYYSDASKIDAKGRTAVLLATAGDGNDSCFAGLKATFELACGYCKWKIAGMVFASGVYTVGEMAGHADVLKKAEELGASL